jgi:hypothetical protein
VPHATEIEIASPPNAFPIVYVPEVRLFVSVRAGLVVSETVMVPSVAIPVVEIV